MLGYSSKDAETLRRAIFKAISIEDAVIARKDQYGQRYIVDFGIKRTGKPDAMIRTTWIIRSDEDFPRLTSCYVL